MTPRIAILNGSARANNNADGVVEWVRQALANVSPAVEIVLLDLKGNTPPLPLGVLTTPVAPLAMPYIPGKKENPDGSITWPYLQPGESKWSEMVQSYDGMIIVSPEYNKCIPGEVKNTIDHIFPEWENFPLAVVTYGSQGGDSCAAQMSTLLKAIKAKVISCEEIMVRLPFEEYIAAMRRTKPEDEVFDPLRTKLEGVVEAIVAAGKVRRAGLKA